MNLPELLAARRAALVDLLTEADVDATGHLPEQLHPPLALVEPADPYLTDNGQVGYGGWSLTYDVYLVTARGTSEAMTEALDALIGKAVQALDTDTFDVTRVARPYGLDVKNTRGTSTRYLATRVTVTTQITT